MRVGVTQPERNGPRRECNAWGAERVHASRQIPIASIDGLILRSSAQSHVN